MRAISRYGNRFMFTGREYLYTLGIYDYRHRLYHPGLGRFIQTDPIGFNGDPMNLYRYCGSNPVLHSDPTGLFDWTWRNLMLWQGSVVGTVTEQLNPKSDQPAGTERAAMAPAPEGKKEQTHATRTHIEHDESFEVTKDPIYVTDNHGKLVAAKAKTFRRLEAPEADYDTDGNIVYTQHVTSITTFKAGGPYEDVAAEWRRVEGVRNEVKELKTTAQLAAFRGFKTPGEAKEVIGHATQRDWNHYLLESSTKLEVIGGGK